ncbi:hypothetical protein GGI07_000287 [Coemansia sp. Benny D115]|nr:hypothetical protein GGI07_000287 [Coemansia sp. Benny D115]
MADNTEQLVAGRPPAKIIGGRRLSQNTNPVPDLSKESDHQPKSKEEQEQGDSEELIRQEELDKKLLYDALRKKQENAYKNYPKSANFDHNKGLNLTKNNQINQPSRFPAGIPKETKMAMKEFGRD